MRPIVIGITGGSGAGKSSLSQNLIAQEPDIYGLIQLDDYLRKPSEVPMLDGRENWDHPDALDFDKFVHDLSELKAGRKVTLLTKNRRFNPDYGETKIKIPIEVRPKPIILAEGFYLLYDEQVRALLDKSIWLEASHESRWDRRKHFKDDEYRDKMFGPMHQQFIEPTKAYADMVLDADTMKEDEILRRVERWLQPYLISGEFRKLI